MNIWSILGIEATTDIAAIKKAYARRAAECHPEEDPKGFQELYEAYADAMEIARARSLHSSESEEKPAPEAPVFRAVPKNLHSLGNVRPASEEQPSPLPKVVSPQAGPLVVGYHQFPPSPSPEDNAPPKPSEDDGGYQFPKGNAANAQEPEEMPERAEGYRFAKGGVVETLPPDGDALPQEENTGEYQFPKGSPDAPSAPEPVAPMGGAPVTSTGTPLVFPGFMFPDVAADGGMPFMPFMSMAAAAGFQEQAQEQYPQTREAAEHLQLLEGARQQCLEEMRTFLEQNAPEQAWYPLLLGADFTLIQYDGKFLLALQRLCRKQLPMEMASALYMAYGFASIKSLRKYPVAVGLHAILDQFLQLPQEDIPLLSLSENLHKSDAVFAGLARLSAACREPFVCDQAVRTPAFVHVKHQPYFLLKLAAFLTTNDVAEEWRQALAQTYQFRESPASACLKALAEQLPAATGTPGRTDYNPASDTLLLDEAALETFYTAARENMLELVQKTWKAFSQSTRREPWDYVFTRPEFALVRRDALFLAWMLFFLKEGNWPAGIRLTLADAYAAEFATLPQNAPELLEPSPDLSPEEQVTANLLTLQHTLASYQEIPPENPSFLEIIKSLFRSA